MNDELVKIIRNCANNSAPCHDCEMSSDPGCIDTLLRQAAGVIEELSAFRERINHIHAIQYLYYYGDHAVQEQVAYFDDREIGEDEVSMLIKVDYYDPRVAVLTRKQAEKVFGFKWIEQKP